MLKKRELIVDSFAGGGGAGQGIAQALGRAADIAINHDPAAIAMYAANHPGTLTMTEDVWKINPRQAIGRQPVGLLWASPDCKHFSRAKGGKPVEKRIRSLAWVVVKWAAEVKPRVIILENVREFAEWGPLLPAWRCKACAWRGTEGQAVLFRGRRRCPRCESLRLESSTDLIPDPFRKGLTFARWVGRLKSLGYAVEWKNLNAADYSAPTHRRRLFLVARRDGEPIVWPAPTHADPKKIDEHILFERPKPWRTAAECIDWSLPCPSIFDRKRPLAEATLRRIALGIKRYVLENSAPFLVSMTHTGERRPQGIDEPLPTITSAHRGELALVTPFLAGAGGPAYAGKPRSIEEPFGTLLGENHTAFIAPTLIQTGYGERGGQAPRVPGIEKPLGTVVSGGQKHAVVAAFLAKHYGGQVGQRLDVPLPTTVSRGTQTQLVAANLVKFNFGEKQWYGADEPLPTVTTQSNKFGLVYSFLLRYFGTAVGQHLTEPLYTITGKDRFGLVLVQVNGQPHVIADIGMRMLTPRELARAQGFPDSYVLTGTKTSQVARIGNSVCPAMARAIVAANFCQQNVEAVA